MVNFVLNIKKHLRESKITNIFAIQNNKVMNIVKGKQSVYEAENNIVPLVIKDDDGHSVNVGSINHDKKRISPEWGYFAPNPISKKLKAIAKRINYDYKEW